MIGIYKIKSPSNRIYIGQSVNIEKRWNKYKNYLEKRQPKLYNSFIFYGVENHIFEIIEECDINILDEKEIYWKQYYLDLIGWNNVLFCYLIDGKGGYKSQETKDKISKGHLNLKHSEETKAKMRKPKNISYPCSKEKANKISISNKNRIFTQEHINNLSLSKKGKAKPEGFGINHSKKMKGKQFRLDKNQYIFFNKITNEIYKGIRSDFYLKYNLPINNVNALIRKEQKSVKNWIII